MDAEMIRTLKEVRDALRGINKSLHHIAEMMEPVRYSEDQIDVSMRGLNEKVELQNEGIR